MSSRLVQLKILSKEGPINVKMLLRLNPPVGLFDVKDAPLTGRPIVENVGNITEIIQIDRYVSSRSIAQELQIDHKIVLNHFQPARTCQRRGVVFHQDNDRSHNYGDSPESLGAWLRKFNASTIFSEPGAKRLPPLSCIAKLPE
ncbi:hypothetical protein TNCV_415191 [Trichonephila clavipes]|nr:hypothetical protein TNCV_415191 [Trichonephila clavipes]